MTDKDTLENGLPKLTLTPDIGATLENVSETPVQQPAAGDLDLTDEEKNMVAGFSSSIDLKNQQVVLLYGAAAQKKIADFADTTLDNVRTKDAGEVGNMLASLVTELKGFSADLDDDKGGLFGWLRNKGQKISTIKAKYDKIEVNVDRISEALEGHQVVLLKDVSMLDKLYNINRDYFKEISLYILAGEQRLEEVRAGELAALKAKAAQTQDAMDIQQARDLSDMCERFERKLYDLKLSRQVSIQTAPQIRMLQNNDSTLVEKIQSSLVNTIPIWKSQMIMALGLSNAQKALQAQQAVTNLTNEMLKRNAEMLKQGTLETAKEAERGIVDIETLKQTNDSLISTIDEVIQIQTNGREQRKKAETELAQMESELKQKLLDVMKAQQQQ